ncbi:Pyrroline-5-carboxylate reductase [Granulibacter bethesdensis]|uniref:Pyrroline-5-carboxylate reductase n=2 Tax=Granulibacter bethesdensis TaxID=364410 RepID=A0AAN0RFU4_9PROT|nr:Pyrroline-5-carboxylate reductase [Granulibacter bethesdensis]AHJ65201.1 Pyrroline-5-carboxylate reductase [Granulibacter bethesdensis CGDNIH4]
MCGGGMSLPPIPPILLVGCGKMGSAMLRSWQERGLSRSFVVSPSPRALGESVTVVPDATHIPADFRPAAVILAVKPQVAPSILPDYARFAGHSVFLSVMAGLTQAGLAGILGEQAAIVRSMPNTPSAIGKGFTMAHAGPHVDGAQRSLCHTLLEAVGTVAWAEQETELLAATAISGGGPAYVFLMAELLERCALEQGLEPDLARSMARQTVIGAASLLEREEADAAVLRRAVTSPGGTTEQALKILMAENALPSAFSRAVKAAIRRAGELSGAPVVEPVR